MSEAYVFNATNLDLEKAAELLTKLAAVSTEDEGGAVSLSNATQIWILIAAFLVFWMHAGFTMLEAGSVQHKNAVNIMFKNIGTVSIGAICYYLIGYGLAYGEDNAGEGSEAFISVGGFANKDMGNDNRHFFFFQFAFAATAATIVSGAVAGRINLPAYFATAAYLTAFVYPVVSHWVWGTGFLSAFIDERFLEGCGAIDYAGSGVVHMTGGVAAFIGAKILGPRIGRFDSEGTPVAIPPHNISLQTLGVFILWFGWYGFNCGSTLLFDGPNASKVAVTTTLAPSAAVVTGIIAGRFLTGHYDIGIALNCALAGLVSITAPCPVVEDWAAIIIGIIGAFVYIGSSKLMVKLGIDDPVDAIAVHGCAGAWGLIAVAIFATDANISNSYGFETCDTGKQFGTQFVLIFTIIAWVIATCIPFFLVLKVTGVLRVSAEDEEAGLDSSEHGGSAAFKSGAITPSEA